MRAKTMSVIKASYFSPSLELKKAQEAPTSFYYFILPLLLLNKKNSTLQASTHIKILSVSLENAFLFNITTIKLIFLKCRISSGDGGPFSRNLISVLKFLRSNSSGSSYCLYADIGSTKELEIEFYRTRPAFYYFLVNFVGAAAV